MKILAIIGTNRRNGTIERLVNSLLNGVEKRGIHRYEKINLHDYKIGNCRGCWVCVKKGTCIIQDDVQSLINKVIASDVIILGIPCYWGNVPGIVKTFFDRHTGYVMQKPRDAEEFKSMKTIDKFKKMIQLSRHFGPIPAYRNKKFILISSMTVPFPISYVSGDLPGLMGAIQRYVHNIRGKIIRKIIYTDSLFKILERKEERYLKKVFSIGYNLVKQK
ncbi:MAG: flavodoxin family protein [Spirochaetales bacterium]|nr:flavodoxin family protein [Spirochaetales bacterium]